MPLADPKPVKTVKVKKAMKRWKRPTKTTAASKHLGNVKRCNCAACGAPAPSDAHHTCSDQFGRSRSSDWATTSLCKLCHWEYHNDKAAFEKRYCKDYAFIPQVLQAIYGDEWSEDH